MFDNLCKSWPRGSQQCINRLKNKQTSYRVLNTVLIKVLYERCGSWPKKCYGDGYSTGWLRHFIATRRYEFFNFRSAEARSDLYLFGHPRATWVFSKLQGLRYYFPENFSYDLKFYESDSFCDSSLHRIFDSENFRFPFSTKSGLTWGGKWKKL